MLLAVQYCQQVVRVVCLVLVCLGVEQCCGRGVVELFVELFVKECLAVGLVCVHVFEGVKVVQGLFRGGVGFECCLHVFEEHLVVW